MDTIQSTTTSTINHSNGMDGVGGWEAEARLMLQLDIDKHNAQMCECYLTKDKEVQIECRASAWANGKIPSKNIVQDYYLRQSKNNR